MPALPICLKCKTPCEPALRIIVELFETRVEVMLCASCVLRMFAAHHVAEHSALAKAEAKGA